MIEASESRDSEDSSEWRDWNRNMSPAERGSVQELDERVASQLTLTHRRLEALSDKPQDTFQKRVLEPLDTRTAQELAVT